MDLCWGKNHSKLIFDWALRPPLPSAVLFTPQFISHINEDTYENAGDYYKKRNNNKNVQIHTLYKFNTTIL